MSSAIVPLMDIGSDMSNALNIGADDGRKIANGMVMGMREKMIEILRCGIEHHEELREKWIIGGKVGERPSIIKSFADLLVANDVVQVVRCKDCKAWIRYGKHTVSGYCGYLSRMRIDDDFCSYGERKDNV